MEKPERDVLLTAVQAAGFLDLSLRQFKTLLSEGKVRALIFGRKNLFLRSEVLALVGRRAAER